MQQALQTEFSNRGTTMNVINLEEYKDKVFGCWTGKNVGGTLGVPFEGRRDMNEIEFYSQVLDGSPAPNDDLDLQLVWLHAIREHGAANLSSQLLGEYWLGVINGPWNEYGVCKANMRAGLMPPLSGSCNNNRWEFSNGAWIRSEIWACITPGNPDKAIQYAYMDACVDHCGEGIYAEMFTAALESAAFIVSDMDELISIGLSKIPSGCRIARSVNIAINCHKGGKDWKETREALVRDSADLGWFQAPANIGFTVLALLYGEGDFGKTVCRAVNCGDDTDCTAATAGAILGIMGGRKSIPGKWLSPIGESIITACLNPFVRYPHTLGELTEKVTEAALHTIRTTVCIHNSVFGFYNHKSPVSLEDAPTGISGEWLGQLRKTEAAADVWSKSPFALSFDLPYAQVVVDYIDGSELASGEAKQVKVLIRYKHYIYGHTVVMNWRLPDDWQITPDRSASFYLGGNAPCECSFSITPGKLEGGFSYIEMEIRCSERQNPAVICVPFQKKDTVHSSEKKFEG